MLVTLLFTSAIAALIGYLTFGHRFFMPRRTKRQIQKYLVSHGSEAEAIILVIQETGRYRNGKPEVALQLQVQPEIGKSFITEITDVWPSYFISKLRAGVKISVKFNPNNHKEVALLTNIV